MGISTVKKLLLSMCVGPVVISTYSKIYVYITKNRKGLKISQFY